MESQLNCYMCGMIFVSTKNALLSDQRNAQISRLTMKGFKKIMWTTTCGVCQKCKTFRSGMRCEIPSCEKKSILCGFFCEMHTNEMKNRCPVPGCPTYIQPTNIWTTQERFCEKHRCMDGFKTETGFNRCPFQAIEGKSRCVSCNYENSFLIAFRFQLAGQVGQYVSDVIFSRM